MTVALTTGRHYRVACDWDLREFDMFTSGVYKGGTKTNCFRFPWVGELYHHKAGYIILNSCFSVFIKSG